MSNDRTLTYLALAELAARWAAGRGHGVEVGLTGAELRVFSQNGEDGVLQALLARVGVSSRRFVEFGAETGREGNCVFLADVLGWTGLFMEADPSSFARLSTKYRDLPGVQTLQAGVTPANINALLTESGMTGEIDVLSIDIDGHDYWVWKAISAVSARVVVIEYNAHVRYPDRQVQPLDEVDPWNGTDFYGASLGALEHLADDLGYALVHTELAGVNAFFVRADLAEGLPSGGAVPRRAPNFFLLGEGHPPDTSGRRFIDPVT